MRLMAEEQKQDREAELRRLEAVEQRRREDECELREAQEERMAQLITVLAQKQEHFEAAQKRRRGELEQRGAEEGGRRGEEEMVQADGGKQEGLGCW